MTISTYSELKTAIANYSHRSDLSGRDDEFIDSFEAKLNRRLKIRAMEASATGNMVSGTATLALPTDFMEVRSVTFNPTSTSLRKLEYITPEQAESFGFVSNGEPQYYTFVGGVFRFYPTPDSAYAYTLRYYKKITDLDGTDTTNYVLTNFPDVYLYGCLVEYCIWAADDQGAARWKVLLDEAMAELIRHDRRERFVTPAVQFDSALTGGYRANIETDGL